MDPVVVVDPVEAIQALGGGTLIERLYAAMVMVAEEVIMTRHKGAVTLKLNVEIAPGSDDVVIVSEDLQRKPPAGEAKGAMFFSIGDGQLHRRDPRQQYFDVRHTEEGQAELRMIEQASPKLRGVNQ